VGSYQELPMFFAKILKEHIPKPYLRKLKLPFYIIHNIIVSLGSLEPAVTQFILECNLFFQALIQNGRLLAI